MVLSVRLAIFQTVGTEVRAALAITGVERSENGRAHGYYRCLGRAKPRGLLRCLARAKRRGLLLVHVGRSLATSCWCSLGCARSEAGLVGLRPSERSETLRVGAGRTGVHRSGLVQRSWTVCKAGESGQGAGGTVPGLAPKAFGEVSAL